MTGVLPASYARTGRGADAFGNHGTAAAAPRPARRRAVGAGNFKAPEIRDQT